MLKFIQKFFIIHRCGRTQEDLSIHPNANAFFGRIDQAIYAVYKIFLFLVGTAMLTLKRVLSVALSVWMLFSVWAMQLLPAKWSSRTQKRLQALNKHTKLSRHAFWQSTHWCIYKRTTLYTEEGYFGTISVMSGPSISFHMPMIMEAVLGDHIAEDAADFSAFVWTLAMPLME